MAKDFTTTFLVDQSRSEVFNAVINVRGWWQGLYAEEIKGDTAHLHDEFSFRAGDGAHYTEQKMIEMIPDKRIVWLVTKSELTFIEKKDEWQGTRIVFDISEKGNKTQIQFTHQGLVPEVQCYAACSSAWQMYLQEKLLSLIKSSKSLNVSGK